MSKVREVYDKVLDILISSPITRGSDCLLISKVDSLINPVVADMPYSTVMANRTQFGLPSCESIVRARRKAQELKPELKPSKEIQDIRLDEEIDYSDFARSVK